jgi:hypothetical protein
LLRLPRGISMSTSNFTSDRFCRLGAAGGSPRL